jgi:HlyD family secretion protein
VLEGEVATAKTDEARFEQLVERRAGSLKQRDDAVARRHSAESRLQAAGDAALAAGRTGAAPIGRRSREIEGAVARVAVVNAQIAALEHDRGETAIVSPATGIVSSRLVEPGELVAVGTPSRHHRRSRSRVGERLRRGAARAGAARGTVADRRHDGGDRLTGAIAFIAPRAEFTPRNVQTSAERARLVYRVKVTVDNSAAC